MSRQELQRVHELLDQMKSDPLGSEFIQFEKSLNDNPSKKRAFLCLEKELQRIDVVVWDYFKKQVASLSTWRELMDRINELKGYIYLADMGCEDIRPIPREEGRTPDWQATSEGRKVFLEVKTINTSDAEMEFRNGNKVRRPNSDTGTSWVLSDKLLQQIALKINDAAIQLREFDDSEDSRRIAFIVIHFDDFLGGYPEYYFPQIEKFLSENPVQGIGAVCYGKTVFGEGRVSFDWHEI